jgi:hypothetical protein
MSHRLTLISPAHPGTRLPRGRPEEQGGYRADDPPEEAVYRCECGWEGDGRECPNAVLRGDCPGKDA